MSANAKKKKKEEQEVKEEIHYTETGKAFATYTDSLIVQNKILYKLIIARANID